VAPTPDPAVPAFSRRNTLIAAATLVAAGFAVHANSLTVPFFFDDRLAIVENPTIRHLAALGQVLSPPANGSGVDGRPLVNLSFALNYAFGGTAVRGYHVVNLIIHVLAGLTLFGLVRRILTGWRSDRRESRPADPVTWWALAVAGLWLVHPLQTETVTCVIQRTESLVSLFYLTCLYASVRAMQSPRGGLWTALAVSAALAGMATKEVMVTAPALVLLLDRTFISGSFAAAWRRHRHLHLGLAATWLLLALLLLRTGGSRGTVAGFGLGVTPWNYALTQCEAITTYLWLAVWPQNLVLDYGTDVVANAAQVIPEGLAVLALVGGTALALWRRPAVGFLGAWFLIILSPSSSFVPLVSQTIAEHRMYLPLAAVIAGLVAALHAWLGRRGLLVCLALAVGLGARTVARNDTYRNEVSILTDTVAKRPGNVRALNNLGNALARAGRTDEALIRLRAALQLKPDHAPAHANLGNVLDLLNRLPEAETEMREALRLDPNHNKARYNLGNVLLRLGKNAEAADQLREAVRLEPSDPVIRHNYALALVLAGRRDEGIAELREVLRQDPGSERSRMALQQLGAVR
jgi:tetratricopeptide (TPR) repeat protein